MISVFQLEKRLIPFYEWVNHKDKLPTNIWNMIANHMAAIELYGGGSVGPLGLGFDDELGYYMLASGQGPFVVWMEKPIPVDGPYPYDGKAIDYGDVKLDKLYLSEREFREIENRQA